MTNHVFKYRDQIGSVETDLDRGCLYGKLLHIDDLVTYEADSIPALENEFKISVDEYLADCEELGIEPNKPFKGSFNVRVGPELHRLLAIKSAETGAKLNELVSKAVELYLEEPVVVQHVHDHRHEVVLQREISDFNPQSEITSWDFKRIFETGAIEEKSPWH